MIDFKKNNVFLNEGVNACLNSIIKNKSFANGYIFFGAEGVGKKQTALLFIEEILKQLTCYQIVLLNKKLRRTTHMKL